MDTPGDMYASTLPGIGEFALPGNLVIHNPSMSIIDNIENSGLSLKELDNMTIIIMALKLKEELLAMFQLMEKYRQKGGSANQESIELAKKEIEAFKYEDLHNIPKYSEEELEKAVSTVPDTAGGLPEVRLGIMPPAELYKSPSLSIEKRQKDISVTNKLLAIMCVIDKTDEPVEMKAATILSKYNTEDIELEQSNVKVGGSADPQNPSGEPETLSTNFKLSTDAVKQMIADAKTALSADPNLKEGNDVLAMKKLATRVEQQLIWIQAEAHWQFYTKNPETKVRSPEQYLEYLRWNTAREFAEIKKAHDEAKAMNESQRAWLGRMKFGAGCLHALVGAYRLVNLERLNIEGQHERSMEAEKLRATKAKGLFTWAYNAVTNAAVGAAPTTEFKDSAAKKLLGQFLATSRTEIIGDAMVPAIQNCVEACSNDPIVIATSQALLTQLDSGLRAGARDALQLASRQYAKVCQEYEASTLSHQAQQAHARSVFLAVATGIVSIAGGPAGMTAWAKAAIVAFSGQKIAEAGVLKQKALEEASEINKTSIFQLTSTGGELLKHEESLEKQIADARKAVDTQTGQGKELVAHLEKNLQEAHARRVIADKQLAREQQKKAAQDKEIAEERVKRDAAIAESAAANAQASKAATNVQTEAGAAGVPAKTFAAVMEGHAASNLAIARLQLSKADPNLAAHINIEGRAKAITENLGLKGGGTSPAYLKNAKYFELLNKENEEINKLKDVLYKINDRNEKLAAILLKQQQLVPPDAELINRALMDIPTAEGTQVEPKSNLNEAAKFFNVGTSLLESAGANLNTRTSMNQTGGGIGCMENAVKIPPIFEIFLLNTNTLPPLVVKLAFAMINGIENTALGLEDFTKIFLATPQPNVKPPPSGGSLYDNMQLSRKGYRGHEKRKTRKGMSHKRY